MSVIGIPREIKTAEKRVGLTPKGVRHLREAGVTVLVEKGAGEGSGFSDSEYEKAGARIVSDPSELYRLSDLVQKVKEPQRSELNFFKPDLILCCYLHLASPEQRELLEGLLKRQVTAIGFETVTKNGRTVLLEPMSEIAGTLAAYYAGFIPDQIQLSGGEILEPPHFLKSLESLASKYPQIPKGLPPVHAVIFGGGAVGQNAAETLIQMGGKVELIEKNPLRRKALLDKFQKSGAAHFRVWDPQDDLGRHLAEADVWIGCVHVAGERAPLILSKDDLKKLSEKKNKLILDVAADQGGNFPETHSTTYENPLYLDSFGNLRFAVTNIPSLAGRGASEALEQATLPYLISLGRSWGKALLEFPELRSGIQTFSGRIANEAVARSHQREWAPYAS